MRAHRPLLLLLAIFIIFTLQSCASVLPSAQDTQTSSEERSEYDGELLFEGRRYTFAGDPENITARDDAIIIRKSGRYLLSGELTEGRVMVDCQGEVCLVLGGVTMRSSAGAVIERAEGELALESLPDSINILSADSKAEGEFLPSGCILVGGGILFCGEGKIIINSKRDGGVVCNGMTLESGELSLSCESYGVWARDNMKMLGGRLTVTNARVGIFAFGGEYSRGRIEITGGELVAVCAETALFAERELSVMGGTGDIRARSAYKCERTENGETVSGKLSVYDGFLSGETK